MCSIVYIIDAYLHKECDRIPQVQGRASLVYSLIQAYNLLSHMHLVPSTKATDEDLKSFHSSDYIKYLQQINDNTDLEKHNEDELEYYGLAYDCPLITHIYDFVKTIAGGSLTAAQYLVDETANIAVNWCGGWHHAQRDKAEGFCYVNDIVIAIQKLREKYDKVLYIDLDIHHGDGVENAFLVTKKVLTLSFHKHGPGFYPGSGAIADTGSGNGKLYSINVPLKDGIKDDLFFKIFDSVTSKVSHVFRPNAVVVQCGADCLNKDPMGTFNLTPKGLGECICKVLAWKLPLLFLGGGGYNLANTARYWTYLTSIILDQKIPSEIPEHRYFTCYGPDFDLHITPGCRRDFNTKEYIEDVIKIIHKNLDDMVSLPSENDLNA
uniref:Histone deacetylase n=1 Tax=Timema genevievae TaxID=629358 RepID=A0A7R9JZT7_TIMGE|nr:unnamed protein product [Timema genevievae]